MGITAESQLTTTWKLVHKGSPVTLGAWSSLLYCTNHSDTEPPTLTRAYIVTQSSPIFIELDTEERLWARMPSGTGYAILTPHTVD